MQTFKEKKLLFDFPDDWQVTQYDALADLVAGAPAGFYRRIVTGGGVKHVQAVDFICNVPGVSKRLQFVEVKDDRLDARAEGERRTLLFEAVMSKVAGTLASLVIAERLGEQMDDDLLRPMACLSEQPVIEVVLFWVEPPVAGTTLRRAVKKGGKTTLQQRLAAKLHQWGMLFSLYNMADADRLASDWQVREVPA
ncbi:hypothetical protein SAMN02745146_0880 [Hymenobacter daecheongensis DSM 21074]|uniref:Uncharacterized protein n=1 Tax=Hymenobacter daecheongensis DSM 21074 TaxID=1121955 RepID=A0A1M6B574_9BACT|nr:hypothetical protein [Hymenobacter daecheongensis]SHI43929.1 hypothetical protein SAMN02745146_0880 [Hymenobacter daecheongensis DSM 21074]